MNSISKLGTKLLIGALSLSSTFGGIADVSACGGRGGGGGGGGGFGGGYFRPPQANYQQAYYPPAQTYYPQTQSYPSGPVSFQQFPGGQQQPANAVQPATMPTGGGGGMPAATNGTIQQAQFNQNVPVQGAQAAPTQLPTAGATPTATQNSFAATPTQPTQPQTPAAAPAPTPAPSTGNVSSAEASALQALAGFGLDSPPAASTGASQTLPATTAEYVGNWSASLPNGTSVQLVLQADGSFRWVATREGKSTSFEGTYAFENGALTLARSSDNQKLTGAMTSTNRNGFNFKLTGAKDTGLDFTRG